MAKWLLKTEPSEYSLDQLERAKRATWDGVSNALALKHLRTMAVGDEVVIYHTGDEKAAVGLAKVVKAAYPDPKGDDAKQVVVDIAFVSRLKKPVTLAAIKADKRFANWALVKMGRLSVVPTDETQWTALLELAGE